VIDPRFPLGRILAFVLPLPALLLAVFTLRANHVASPAIFVDPAGDSILALPLAPAPGDTGGIGRFLDADGLPVRIAQRAVAVPAPSTWILWRDDAPLSMGRLSGVLVDAGDTLRGERAREALRRMPAPLSRDEHRLVERLRTARDRRDSALALDALERFLSRQRTVVALLQAPGRAIHEVPLVRIRHVEVFEGGWADGVMASARRLWFRMVSTADAGSGGGLWGALVATALVVLLAGAMGGVPSLFLAVHLADQIDPGPAVRWLRWASEGISGVPGVVWGCVGAAGLAYFGDSSWGHEAMGMVPGKGILWAGLALGVLSAPITFTRAMDAIDRVPRSSREIARSCGATRHQVLLWVVIPACRRGLVGAWFAGLARAAGETAPLLLVGAVGSIEIGWHQAGSMPSLSGEFLHLGAMAYEQPWPSVQAHLGHPLAYLALALVAAGCLALEWAALRLGEVRE